MTVPKLFNDRVFAAVDNRDISTIALQAMASVPVDLQILADRCGVSLRSDRIKDDLHISLKDGKITVSTRHGASLEEQRYYAAFALGYVINPDARVPFRDFLEQNNISIRAPRIDKVQILGPTLDRQARGLTMQLLMPQQMLVSMYDMGIKNTGDLASLFRVDKSLMDERVASLQKHKALAASSMEDLRRLRSLQQEADEFDQDVSLAADFDDLDQDPLEVMQSPQRA